MIIINKLLAARSSWTKLLCSLQFAWKELIQGSVEEVKQKCSWLQKINDLPEKEDNLLEVLNEAKGHSRPRADIINNWCTCIPRSIWYICAGSNIGM